MKLKWYILLLTLVLNAVQAFADDTSSDEVTFNVPCENGVFYEGNSANDLFRHWYKTFSEEKNGVYHNFSVDVYTELKNSDGSRKNDMNALKGFTTNEEGQKISGKWLHLTSGSTLSSGNYTESEIKDANGNTLKDANGKAYVERTPTDSKAYYYARYSFTVSNGYTFKTLAFKGVTAKDYNFEVYSYTLDANGNPTYNKVTPTTYKDESGNAVTDETTGNPLQLYKVDLSTSSNVVYIEVRANKCRTNGDVYLELQTLDVTAVSPIVVSYHLTKHVSHSVIKGSTTFGTTATTNFDIAANMPQSLYRGFCNYEFYEDEALTKKITSFTAAELNKDHYKTVYVKYTYDEENGPFKYSASSTYNYDSNVSPIWYAMKLNTSTSELSYQYLTMGKDDTKYILTSDKPTDNKDNYLFSFWGDPYEMRIVVKNKLDANAKYVGYCSSEAIGVNIANGSTLLELLANGSLNNADSKSFSVRWVQATGNDENMYFGYLQKQNTLSTLYCNRNYGTSFVATNGSLSNNNDYTKHSMLRAVEFANVKYIVYNAEGKRVDHSTNDIFADTGDNTEELMPDYLKRGYIKEYTYEPATVTADANGECLVRVYYTVDTDNLPFKISNSHTQYKYAIPVNHDWNYWIGGWDGKDNPTFEGSDRAKNVKENGKVRVFTKNGISDNAEQNTNPYAWIFEGDPYCLKIKNVATGEYLSVSDPEPTKSDISTTKYADVKLYDLGQTYNTFDLFEHNYEKTGAKEGAYSIRVRKGDDSDAGRGVTRSYLFMWWTNDVTACAVYKATEDQENQYLNNGIFSPDIPDRYTNGATTSEDNNYVSDQNFALYANSVKVNGKVDNNTYMFIVKRIGDTDYNQQYTINSDVITGDSIYFDDAYRKEFCSYTYYEGTRYTTSTTVKYVEYRATNKVKTTYADYTKVQEPINSLPTGNTYPVVTNTDFSAKYIGTSEYIWVSETVRNYSWPFDNKKQYTLYKGVKTTTFNTYTATGKTESSKNNISSEGDYTYYEEAPWKNSWNSASYADKTRYIWVKDTKYTYSYGKGNNTQPIYVYPQKSSNGIFILVDEAEALPFKKTASDAAKEDYKWHYLSIGGKYISATGVGPYVASSETKDYSALGLWAFVPYTGHDANNVKNRFKIVNKWYGTEYTLADLYDQLNVNASDYKRLDKYAPIMSKEEDDTYWKLVAKTTADTTVFGLVDSYAEAQAVDVKKNMNVSADENGRLGYSNVTAKLSPSAVFKAEAELTAEPTDDKDAQTQALQAQYATLSKNAGSIYSLKTTVDANKTSWADIEKILADPANYVMPSDLNGKYIRIASASEDGKYMRAQSGSVEVGTSLDAPNTNVVLETSATSASSLFKLSYTKDGVAALWSEGANMRYTHAVDNTSRFMSTDAADQMSIYPLGNGQAGIYSTTDIVASSTNSPYTKATTNALVDGSQFENAGWYIKPETTLTYTGRVGYENDLSAANGKKEYRGASFYFDFPVEIISTNGKAYYCSSLTESEATMKEISGGKIPAKTPFVYKQSGDESSIVFNILDSDPNVTISGNHLKGVSFMVNLSDNDENVRTFGVKNNCFGFRKSSTSGKTVGFNVAYLDLSELQGNKANSFRMIFAEDDDNTTGIRDINSNVNDGKLYDLSGRLVETPRVGGIYIQNGKKIVIK